MFTLSTATSKLITQQVERSFTSSKHSNRYSIKKDNNSKLNANKKKEKENSKTVQLLLTTNAVLLNL